eukprot:COSAG03_NODE_11522_length_588_cov_1.143149_1_plen_92_part_01
MPVCGCSAGAGCVRQIEVSGELLQIRQRWHPEDRQADLVDHRPPPGLGACRLDESLFGCHSPSSLLTQEIRACVCVCRDLRVGGRLGAAACA